MHRHLNALYAAARSAKSENGRVAVSSERRSSHETPGPSTSTLFMMDMEVFVTCFLRAKRQSEEMDAHLMHFKCILILFLLPSSLQLSVASSLLDYSHVQCSFAFSCLLLLAIGLLSRWRSVLHGPIYPQCNLPALLSISNSNSCHLYRGALLFQ